MMLLECEFDMN